MASARGNPDVVRALLEGKADPNLPNDEGWLPLDCAIYYRHSEVQNILQSHNAKQSTSARTSDCRSQEDTECSITESLQSLNDVLVHKNSNSLSYHLAASLRGDTEVITEIMKTLDVNAANEVGLTLVHCAAVGAHDEILALLSESGADLKAKTSHGTSVLHFASLSGRLRTVEKLVKELKIDPEVLDGAGLSPADYAEVCGHQHIASWLHKLCGRTKPPNTELMNISKKVYSCILRLTRENLLSSERRLEDLATLLDCGVCNIHLQDERGWTLLHEAAHLNRREEIAFLKKRGALSNARSHDRKTPAELARLQGHHEAANFISSHSNGFTPKHQDVGEKCRLHLQLLWLITSKSQEGGGSKSLDAAKECSKLLESGAPLELHCCHDGLALSLAITSNCTPLLPLLLSSGAPLTTTQQSLGLVHLALSSENVTPWLQVLVVRAAGHRLRAEINFPPESPTENILQRIIGDLSEELLGDTPWLAECPDFLLSEDEHILDMLLEVASERGATTAAWWLWKKGGHIHPSYGFKTTALHTAIKAKKFDTAFALFRHMKANPFLKDSEGHMAIDLLPETLKEEFLQIALTREYHTLYSIQLNARMDDKVREIQQLILYLLTIGLEHRKSSAATKKENAGRKMLFGVLLKSLPAEANRHSWVVHTLKSFRHFVHGIESNAYKIKHEMESNSGDCYFSSLTKAILGAFPLLNAKRSVDKHFADRHQKLQTEGIKKCCEENLPFFLHLLVTVDKVSANTLVISQYKVTALQHAVRYNNASAVSYLVSRGAHEYLDSSGNTPARVALMHGHKGITRKLQGGFPYKGSIHLSQDFAHYMKSYQINSNSVELLAHEMNDPRKITSKHLKLLQREWQEKGILNSIRGRTVDFLHGESCQVKKAVNDFVARLLAAVSVTEPYLEGSLLLLGSSADNARLSCPDEYDFNLVLKNIHGHPGGGIKVSLHKTQIDHKGRTAAIELSSDREDVLLLLQGDTFLDKFHRAIENSLPDAMLLDKRLSIKPPGVEKTQVGAGLSLIWHGQEFPLLHVDVDIVPTIEAPWPEGLDRPPLTPPEITTVDINSIGDGQWRFSFARAENMIMTNITDDQRNVFLVCKIILAKLKPEKWAPRDVKEQFKYLAGQQFFNIAVPNGFILKNSFFLELQEANNEKLWLDNLKIQRIISIFRRMCLEVQDPRSGKITLDAGKIKAYFGRNFEASCFGFGAPEIVDFLNSLPSDIEW